MQEQNLEEWKEKIDRSAEQITVPDTLTPGAVQQMLEERKNRTSAGRKEHRHYRRFAGIAAAVAVLVIAVGTYGWNKYGTDDAQPKKAALSVTNCRQYAGYRKERTNRCIYSGKKLPGCICSGTEKIQFTKGVGRRHSG